ncbi:MAG: hypothetical protein JNN12_02130 [Bacteroidetes Order II. Incertae sedis bacterium]|nr:hypothetical protein [Bacteroidetes Order II. bacterium]
MTTFSFSPELQAWANAGLVLLVWSMIALLMWGILEVKQNWHPVLRTGLYRAVMVALPLGISMGALGFPVMMPVEGLTKTENLADSPNTKTVLPDPVPPSAQATTVPTPAPETQAAASLPTNHLFATPPRTDVTSLIWIIGSLGLGMLLLFQMGKFVYETALLRRFRRGLKVSLHPDFQDMLSALSQQLGIRQNRVMLATIPTETVPMTFGWRRPMIVLPASLLEKPLEAEMAIFHELVHIRRHDFVWNWVERVLNLAFWFHPLMYLIRNRIAQTREQVCDTTVLSIGCYPAEAYARLLFQLSAAPAHRPALQMADTFMSLKARLEAMKETVHSQNHIRRANRLGSLMSFAFLTLTTIALAGTKFHQPERHLPVTSHVNATNEDCKLSFESGQISLYGNEDLEVEETYRSHKGFCSGIILHPQTGLIRFSTVPFLNAQRVGSVSKGLLRLSIDGVQVAITSQQAILANPNRQPLYGARYPYIQPENWRNNRPEGSFERFSNPQWYFGLEAEMPPEEEEQANLTVAGFDHGVIFSPRMMNGKSVTRNVFTMSSLRDRLLFWYVEGIGRIVFSETKFRGAVLTAEVNGKNMEIRYKGKVYNVQMEHNFFRDRRSGQLWVQIEPNPLHDSSGTATTLEEIDRVPFRRGQVNNAGTFTTEEDNYIGGNAFARAGSYPNSSGSASAHGGTPETSSARFAESPADVNLSGDVSGRLSQLGTLLEQQSEQLQWENYQAQDLYNQYNRANTEYGEQIWQYGARISQKQSGLALLQSQLRQQEDLYVRGKAVYNAQRLQEFEQRVEQLRNEIETLKRRKPKAPASRLRSSSSGSRGGDESGNAPAWSPNGAGTLPAWPSGPSDTRPARAPSSTSGATPARTLNGQRVAQPARGTSVTSSNGYTFVCEAGNDCSVTTSCTENKNCNGFATFSTSPLNRATEKDGNKASKPCPVNLPCASGGTGATTSGQQRNRLPKE